MKQRRLLLSALPGLHAMALAAGVTPQPLRNPLIEMRRDDGRDSHCLRAQQQVRLR